MIPTTPVTSSNVSEMGYSDAMRTMAVRFKSGGVYRYPNTTRAGYEAARQSESIGKHLATYHAGKGVKYEEPK